MTPINNGLPSVSKQLISATSASDSSESHNVEMGTGQLTANAASKNPISISIAGQTKLLSDPHSTDDIDASNLPIGIKKFLSAIRAMQENIKEKMRELQKVMHDPSLSPEERQARISQVQFQISVLNNGLFSMTHGMQQLEMQLQVQLDDLTLINKLAAPR